jgi:predicted DNA-binding protein YlxM (UPF0122 family)
MLRNKDGSTSTVELTDIARRRLEVFELRKAGYALQVIADRYGVSKSTIHNDIKVMLAELHDDLTLSAREYRQLEMERLDKMLAAIWARAISGDLHAQKGVISIMRRRAALMGLDAPARVPIATLVEVLRLLDVKGWSVERFFDGLVLSLQDTSTPEMIEAGGDTTPMQTDRTFDS